MHVCLNNILDILDSVNHHIFTSINYLWLSNLRVGGYFGILRFCTLQDLFAFTVTFTCQIGMSLVYHTSQTKYAKKQRRSADFQNVQVQQKTMWQFVIFNWLWICHLYVAWCVKESRARQIPMNITIHILLTRNLQLHFLIFYILDEWQLPLSSFFQMCPISRGNFCLLCSQYIRLPISLPRRKIGKI